ncbi:conserved hypothetical protein [Ktedonobacter racemifer DSM 44963]|uniref:Uncharacterized protein n=1 Tax=Ktedonobacter racemifer DSM 44963 TaxID=485913 RepID=D6TS71_KTERA|nr:conserved hypothetical protein [Ktedonobacter racemifer DSM 44963]
MLDFSEAYRMKIQLWRATHLIQMLLAQRRAYLLPKYGSNAVLMMKERAYYVDVFLVVFIILALLWIIKTPIPKKVSEPLFKSFIGFL